MCFCLVGNAIVRCMPCTGTHNAFVRDAVVHSINCWHAHEPILSIWNMVSVQCAPLQCDRHCSHRHFVHTYTRECHPKTVLKSVVASNRQCTQALNLKRFDAFIWRKTLHEYWTQQKIMKKNWITEDGKNTTWANPFKWHHDRSSEFPRQLMALSMQSEICRANKTKHTCTRIEKTQQQQKDPFSTYVSYITRYFSEIKMRKWSLFMQFPHHTHTFCRIYFCTLENYSAFFLYVCWLNIRYKCVGMDFKSHT